MESHAVRCFFISPVPFLVEKKFSKRGFDVTKSVLTLPSGIKINQFGMYKKTNKADYKQRREEMKFIAIGRYTTQGLTGFMKNPEDDRQAAVGAMMAKAGGTLEALYLTRGSQDVVAIGDAPDFETMAAIKMLVLSSGAFAHMDILEVADFNAIGAKAAQMAGAYKAPGSS